MIIKQINGQFIVFSGIIEVGSFGSFEEARIFMAEQGNLDAQKPLFNHASKLRGEQIQYPELNYYELLISARS